ncbi:MAG: penicillin-binding protein activator [Betaproteobacteria bacterium]|nr:penicillin-binding protein activator [Betaproteobacteria bacterium]
MLIGLAALLCACATPPAQPPASVIDAKPAQPATAPAATQPDTPPAPAQPTAPPPAPREHIALLLPTASAAFASVAESVQQGFLAGAAAEPKGTLPVRVYSADNEADGLTANIRNALKEGAVLIVGGLTRDGATLMARQSLRQQDLPILALNTPDASVSPRFHFISLGLDQEARQIAQLAFNEGAKIATVIHGAGGLARRIQDAFEKEWQRLGGQVVLRIAVTGDMNEAQAIRPKLENLRNDMVFLATDIAGARTVRPYVPIWMTTYATSMSIDPRAEAVANVDLDGVRFLDMPWFVQPDHLAVMVYPRPPAGTAIEQERLYALGIDAWRLALMQTRELQKVPSDGVTGKLRLDPSGQVLRSLTPTEFRDGRATPYAKVE